MAKKDEIKLLNVLFGRVHCDNLKIFVEFIISK